MKRTITRLFDTRAQAESAVRELETMGVDSDDISIVASDGGEVRGEDRSFIGKDAEDRKSVV